MSGKLVAALVAAAVSSASAATVGIVYTKLAPHAGTARGVDDASTVKSAVVLNATENFLDSFADLGVDGDAPACPNRDDARRCVVVARAADIKLNILGYTVSIPPIWLGGDSEDRYASMERSFFAPTDPLGDFGLLNRREFGWEYFGVNKHDPQSNGQSSSDSQTQTTTSSGSPPASPPVSNDLTPSTSDVAPLSFAALDNVVDDAPLVGDNLPQLGGSSGALGPATVPEPSTWLMMLIGAGFLGFIKRRRLAALMRSATH